MRPRSIVLLALVTTLIASFTGWALEPPAFDAVSGEAVLLRYQFSAGEQFDTHMTMNMALKMDMGGMKIDTPAEMAMDMACKVTAIDDNGNYLTEMRITHVTMKLEMMGTSLSFDSETNPDPSEEQFKALAAMLNKTVTATISPRGELIKVDTSALSAALASAGPQGDQAIQQMDQMMNNLFIGLPEGQVKAGDEFEGGTLTQAIPEVGEMVMEIRYKVRAVSSDLKQAILEPSVTLTVKPKEGATAAMDIQMEKYEGWILFDVDGGNLNKSNVLSTVHMIIDQMGQKMDMVMDMDVVCAVE